MKDNTYLPFRSEILEVIKHADLEYTFRMAYDRGKEHPVKPGQFFEISIPKYGEAPISVSGITDHSLDFTIRKVGSLTNEIFENYVGDHFFLRGPYGNGFDVNMFKGKEIILVAGGSGLSPIHGVIDYGRMRTADGDRGLQIPPRHPVPGRPETVETKRHEPDLHRGQGG